MINHGNEIHFRHGCDSDFMRNIRLESTEKRKHEKYSFAPTALVLFESVKMLEFLLKSPYILASRCWTKSLTVPAHKSERYSYW